MRVSIVHWNRPAECAATVKALKSQGLPLEITVIDNHSTLENFAALENSLPHDVELIRQPLNLGWGKAHNIVIDRWLEQETTEFCVVSAHDALPEPDCLTQLANALSRNPQWGMACPEYGTPEIPTYSLLRGARLRSVPPRSRGTHEEVAYCHGTLAVLRRQCVRAIGPYDECYFAYGDETEYGIRARERGWKVGLVWGATVVNPGSWSGSAVIGYLWTRNSLRLAHATGGAFGMCVRLLYIAGVTGVLWFRRVSADSLSSPVARRLAIRDYLRGYCGPPPEDVRAEHQKLSTV